MTLLAWLTLAGICLAGAASPGPSLAVVLSSSVSGGRPSGLAAAWAHASGVAIYALLTVFGVSALLSRAPLLFSALQLGGAAYLLFLALRLLRSHGGTTGNRNVVRISALAAARDGFAVAFLNPKLGLFMLALFSQFVAPDYGPGELAIMVATAGAVDGLWYTLVTLLCTRPRWLASLQARGSLIDRLLAALLAALAITLLLRTAASLV
jgi:threonine/homoserine/homoserine lactone efflux protein